VAGIFLKAPDGTQRPVPREYSAVRAITASAQKVNLADKKDVAQLQRRRNTQKWQDEAWDYARQIGEVNYSLTLVGNVTSRCRLYPAIVNDMGTAPAAIDKDDPDLPEGVYEAAARAVRRLESAIGGQSSLLREAAINLGMTGECYLVQTPKNLTKTGVETWDIKSISEVVVREKTTYLKSSPDAPQAEWTALPETAFIGRIWRPDPQWSDLATSSLQGLLDLMDELLLLNRAFRATERSRLNAGLLYIPDTIHAARAIDSEETYDPDTDSTSGETEADQDDLEDELMESMTIPIEDESSAAAVVPLLLRGPVEAAEAIKLIKFERSFDQNLAARADKVLERILLGLDIPKDIIQGLANIRFSNASIINEHLYRAHIEPLVVMICDALTYVYFRPALLAEEIPEEVVKKLVIWYDPSEIVTRPDRAEDANQGYDRMAISAAAWRAAHGFTEEDAPDKQELIMRLALEHGQLTPELSEALLTWIAPDIFAQVRGANAAPGAGGQSGLPPEIANALEGGGTEGQPPATPGEQAPVTPPEPTEAAPTPSAPVPVPPPTPNGATPAPEAVPV
jgi:hypothetical protein